MRDLGALGEFAGIAPEPDLGEEAHRLLDDMALALGAREATA
jgi:hypothetical protein